MNKLQEALESLKQKFTSGNSILVERATILRKEYEAIIETLENLKCCGNCEFMNKEKTKECNSGFNYLKCKTWKIDNLTQKEREI